MYNKIYDFCRVKNEGGAHRNGLSMPPRVEFLVNLISSLGIKYEIDEFQNKRFQDNNFYNIVMLGSGKIGVTAHHDVVNIRSDNANDNSASVINAIALKLLSPSTPVIILDGEEPPMMGVGSQRASEKINSGEYGSIESILNFELTGKGGDNFFIGDYDGPLSDRIISIFNPPVVNTPFNDADIFRRNGIDSVVINPLPETNKKSSVVYRGKNLDFSILYNCHSMKDSVSTIDTVDMKNFVEKVALKIVR
jgi:hypothetical protein